MDRLPKTPPFPVGTRLRYNGTRHVSGPDVVILCHGMEVCIARTNTGRRGTLRSLGIDADGEEALDTTLDGYSVYTVGPFARTIWPEDAHEWEVLSVRTRDIHQEAST